MATKIVSRPDPVGEIVPGGYLVRDDQLAMLGDGDAKRGRAVLRALIMDEREPRRSAGPTPRPLEVRVAGPQDATAVHDLLMVDLEENAAAVAPIDRDEIWTKVRHGLAEQGAIIGVIDGPEGRPVATIGLFMDRWWWSQAWHWVKVWDFVHPEHRQAGHGAKLIQFACWVSDEMTRNFGYRVYTLSGVLATRRARDKVRLYRRHVTPVGAFFLYPPPPEPEG